MCEGACLCSKLLSYIEQYALWLNLNSFHKLFCQSAKLHTVYHKFNFIYCQFYHPRLLWKKTCTHWKNTITTFKMPLLSCLFSKVWTQKWCSERGNCALFFNLFWTWTRKQYGKQHVSAILCISWAGSSDWTKLKRGKGWIINHPPAIWRAVRSHLKKWILQSTFGSKQPASHAINRITWKKC